MNVALSGEADEERQRLKNVSPAKSRPSEYQSEELVKKRGSDHLKNGQHHSVVGIFEMKARGKTNQKRREKIDAVDHDRD